MQRLRLLAIARARILGRSFERVELRLAALDALEPAAHVAHQFGQFVDLAAMLACQRAQFEQPRFGSLERGGVVDQRLGCRLELVFGLAGFDYRAVERRQRFGQQRVLGGNPVKPTRGDAQRCERRIRAFPQVPQFFQIARQLLALLHVGACFGEPRFLARLRFERSQFGEMREQQVLVGLGGLDREPCLGQRILGAAPAGPCRPQLRAVDTGKAIEQRAVAARVDQTAIVVLAVQFDEEARDFAQQADADRLVVDEGLALAVGPELAAHDQRLTILDLDVGIVEPFGERAGQRRKFEARGHAGLVLAAADEPAVGAIAQHEAERVEQDRLARAGFAREHAQPAPEGQVERLDQHDVANGQAGQHAASLLAAGARQVSRACAAIDKCEAALSRDVVNAELANAALVRSA